MRHLIIAGCSYHWKYDEKNLTSIESLIFNKKCTYVHHPGISGISIEYIKESIIHKIGELLNKGVASSDIYLLSNLTQIGRHFVKYPDYLLPNLSDEYKNRFKIGDYVSSALHQTEKSTTNWERKQISNINDSRLPIQNFEIYLESIVILQTFLKKHNISNTLFMMNNVFEGWDTNFKHTYSSWVKPTVPDLSKTLHIKDMSDYCKYLWGIIDLNDFVFHKTPGNNYGGIDEYALDVFKGDKSLYYENNFEITNMWYGQHPNNIIYSSFSDSYNVIDKIIHSFK